MTAACDFCSKADPEWYYPAKEFEMPEAIFGSTGGWAACEECSRLIEDGRHSTVVRERMMGGALVAALADIDTPPGFRLTRSEQRIVEESTWLLYNRFRDNRRGERRPFG